MASSSAPAPNQAFDKQMIEDLKLQLWGNSLKEDVFSRWSQGFVFSESSPSALLQYEGGPCAVIAPVQAFVVKCALFGHGTPSIDALNSITNEGATSLLLAALTEMLCQVNTETYTLVTLRQAEGHSEETASPTNTLTEQAAEPLKPSGVHSDTSEAFFHSNLRYCCCNNQEDLKNLVKHNMTQFQSHYGVLLYLYSILCTKGLEHIRREVEDPSEPLIDGLHGHGSQSLINMLLTSQAYSNVWDNDKDVCGLKLQGLKQQPTIGFLTLLEHMRYCEVGWYYKNPKVPVWLLGSETHLTVLFSLTESLIVKETPEKNASNVFSQFDADGNGFIASTQLDDLLSALDLVAEKEYVDIMRSKLDSEELGIITRVAFMQEFFPEAGTQEHVGAFSLWHVNALVQSSHQGKVMFVEGKAKVAEEIETQFITDTSPLALCLQTKWPSIEVTWSNSMPPSLN